jgi:hypothetical protein
MTTDRVTETIIATNPQAACRCCWYALRALILDLFPSVPCCSCTYKSTLPRAYSQPWGGYFLNYFGPQATYGAGVPDAGEIQPPQPGGRVYWLLSAAPSDDAMQPGQQDGSQEPHQWDRQPEAHTRSPSPCALNAAPIARCRSSGGTGSVSRCAANFACSDSS